jgi:hypothetical protein
MPVKVLAASSLTGLMAIIPRGDVDQFALLEGQGIHEACRSELYVQILCCTGRRMHTGVWLIGS